MKPMFKPPGTEHLKVNCELLLSTFDFKFNLRRYTAPPGPSLSISYWWGR
jgi:hypothetical protein